MSSKNGHDPNWQDPKIASFDAARKKAQAAKKAKAGAAPAPSRSFGQIVFGVVLVALAAGMLVWWGRSLFQSMSFAP